MGGNYPYRALTWLLVFTLIDPCRGYEFPTGGNIESSLSLPPNSTVGARPINIRSCDEFDEANCEWSVTEGACFPKNSVCCERTRLACAADSVCCGTYCCPTKSPTQTRCPTATEIAAVGQSIGLCIRTGNLPISQAAVFNQTNLASSSGDWQKVVGEAAAAKNTAIIAGVFAGAMFLSLVFCIGLTRQQMIEARGTLAEIAEEKRLGVKLKKNSKSAQPAEDKQIFKFDPTIREDRLRPRFICVRNQTVLFWLCSVYAGAWALLDYYFAYYTVYSCTVAASCTSRIVGRDWQ